MHRSVRAGLAVLGVVALPVGFLAVTAQADEPTPTQTIREADLVPALSDTREQGDVEFLREGLLVTTGPNTAPSGSPSNNKAAEYWAAEGGIPGSGSYVWRGTEKQPGTQIVFDLDSDRTNAGSFNVLVGEDVYSTNERDDDLTDWWYTGGQDRATQRGITCPRTDGGSGSDCHGSLPQWQAALGGDEVPSSPVTTATADPDEPTTYPTAEVYAYGFSLGSGVEGEGLLRTVTFGDETYGFTSDEVETEEPTTRPTRQPGTTPPTSPPTTDPTDEPTEEPTDEPTTAPAPRRSDVNGRVTSERDGRTLEVTMTSQDEPANTEVRNKLRWRIAVFGESESFHLQGFDEVDRWSRTFQAGTGRYVVRVFKNGQKVREFVIRTGR